MYSVLSSSTDPALNLALEEVLFDSLSPANTGIFLIWQNASSIIIGRHQNTSEEINGEYCTAHGISVVRRETGGGAVYHDLGNVNFSFMSWVSKNRLGGFEEYMEPMVMALRDLGIPAEFTSRNDITVNGRKVCGTAQRRFGQKMLHHGCVLVDADTSVLSGALAADPEKFQSKGIASHKARVANLIEFLPPLTGREEAVAMVIEAMRKRCGSELRHPEESMLRKAEELAGKKYRNWDWNWGRSPSYTERRRRRFSWGKIELFLNVSQGTIRECRICGDFFALKNTEELENLLKGKKACFEQLETALNGIPLESWFLNSDRREILEFLCGTATPNSSL